MATLLDKDSPQSPVTLTQAAKLVPPTRGNRPVHAATLSRWIMKGVVGRDGNGIKLKALRTPGGWRTSGEWLTEFFEALARDKVAEPAPQPVLRSPARRQRDYERARAELAKVGI
jgi:hypothetical protein